MPKCLYKTINLNNINCYAKGNYGEDLRNNQKIKLPEMITN
jgi:hypothetical protein